MMSTPTTGLVDDFFLDNPEKLIDPFADLAWLREHHPVHKHETTDWYRNAGNRGPDTSPALLG